jgi:uncharacterized protein YkwD
VAQASWLGFERRGRLVVTCVIALTALALNGAAASAATHHGRHVKQSRVHRHPKPVRRATHHVTAPATNPAPQPQPAAAPAQCADANTPATSASLDAMRAAVVCLVNQQRNAHGLPSLTASPQLNNSAQGWSATMVATGNFTHGPGNAFADRISAAGYDWQDAGENIATGYPTPAAVVTAWMASPEHCTNILNPSYRNVGTGESPAAVGIFASGPATWAQDFGLLMSQSPLSTNTGPQKGCPY